MSKLKIVMTRGCPSSGKSTWAKSWVALDPLNWVRINNNEIRSMANGSVYGSDYEKLVRSTRNFLVKEALHHNLNIVLDNVNASSSNWKDTIKIAQEANKDIEVSEKLFYCELNELLERNATRSGVARVPDNVVEKFFKELGGKGFANAVPRVEVFSKRDKAVDKFVEPMIQDETKPKSLICDLDGSLATIGNRSPFVASQCDLTDTAKEHIAEIVRLHYNAGYKVIFCSGRMESDRAPTMRFIEKCLPNMPYVLFLRKNEDFRKDHIIKEEIFNEHIKGKYWVTLIIDDRASVCRQWHSMGLNLVRVGDPDANF